MTNFTLARPANCDGAYIPLYKKINDNYEREFISHKFALIRCESSLITISPISDTLNIRTNVINVPIHFYYYSQFQTHF